ncbi:LURP-one-related/scramblase family protein [Carnobacterium gallinarum]|uniref:LURP-one-related/scramblase family protein n=1 Tax=Carnobacterium gallinarum TaxID=2749 RepID=UPI00055483E1|nr:hypothetical protein [Carnobacterium gallinarum]
MKYIIKQKLIALKPVYDIFTGDGEPLYKVKGSFFGRENFEITDLNGVSLAKCSTDVNLMSILTQFLAYNYKKYHIKVGDQKIISMARSLNFFTYNFKIDSPIGDVHFGYGISGSHQFTLNGEVLCDIDKRKLTIGGDEYHIEIDNKQNQLGFLLTAIALDRIYYTQRS